MVNGRSDHRLILTGYFTNIQIRSINNLHVYLIKFRTNDINRIGINTTYKHKTYILLLYLHRHYTFHIECGNSNPVRKTLVVFRFRIITQHFFLTPSSVFVCFYYMFQLNVNIALRRSKDVSSGNSTPPH